MSVHEIEALREERAGLFAKMTEVNDLAVKESRDFSSAEQETYDKIEADFDAKTRAIERMEKLEGLAPTATRSIAREDAEERRIGSDDKEERAKNYLELRAKDAGRGKWDEGGGYQEAFYRWLYSGTPIEARTLAEVPLELRVQSKATAGAGANIVPVSFGQKIMAIQREFGVMEQLATLITTDSGEQINYPTVTAHGAAAWTAENASYTASDETFGQTSLSAYKAATIVLVSEELLQDAGFDLEAYLINEIALRVSVLENTGYWIGSGSGQPTGLATTVATGVTGATGNTLLVPADNLFDLQHSVKVPYRRNGTFVMHDSSLKVVRKLKDSQNRYLWQPSLTAGTPDTLLNSPIYADPDVPVMAANAKSIYFGDFAQAYLIRDVAGQSMQRLVEKYADTGQVGFRYYERTDGKQVNSEAVKAYVNSAT